MEETKRRRYIIRAVLEGEVDLTDDQEKEIDYTKDALDGVTFHDDGHTYNKTTGALEATTGGHYTDKFSVQQCSYTFGATSLQTLFMWDENDNYLGYFDFVPNTVLFLTENLKCAVSYANTNFIPTLMPVDKSSTTVSEFTIDLASGANNITQTGTRTSFEYDATEIVNAAGGSSANDTWAILNLLNTSDHVGAGGSANGGYLSAVMPHLTINNFAFTWTYWRGKKFFGFSAEGIDSLDAMKDYVINNNIKVTFNKGL